MGIGDYDTTPGNNTDVNGINIAESCPAANINNAIRQVMADIASEVVGRTLDGTISGTWTFSGDPVFSGSPDLSGVGNAGEILAALGLTGALMPFAMSTAPTGWLECDGSAVSRTTYAALFTAIGTTYGTGDGSTTFNLPDYRGEFIRGWDNGRGVDSGRTIGSAQADELEAHTHDIFVSNETTGSSVSAGPRLVGSTTSNADQTSGSTGGSETRPRNVAAMICIKT
ncbi:phage tail protein [uncultured Ruegeria sp.]|uniref:phage tail protein n=1 Tax=uncultured Ruegeria sp. TaxID=259304 RepID=UPI002605D283|nr:phage tail protein [uncultured Ruegeria sp.]